MDRIREFFLLTTSEQLLLVVASILFTVFSAILHVGSLRTSEAFAFRFARLGLSRWSVERVSWAVSVVESNRPGSGGCLPAALVGLALTDESLELRFGVRDCEASIEAHAWLECDDGRLVYVGEEPTEFRPLR